MQVLPTSQGRAYPDAIDSEESAHLSLATAEEATEAIPDEVANLVWKTFQEKILSPETFDDIYSTCQAVLRAKEAKESTPDEVANLAWKTFQEKINRRETFDDVYSAWQAVLRADMECAVASTDYKYPYIKKMINLLKDYKMDNLSIYIKKKITGNGDSLGIEPNVEKLFIEQGFLQAKYQDTFSQHVNMCSIAFCDVFPHNRMASNYALITAFLGGLGVLALLDGTSGAAPSANNVGAPGAAPSANNMDQSGSAKFTAAIIVTSILGLWIIGNYVKGCRDVHTEGRNL